MKNVKLIAFYLTQFHAIPENDRWWGAGFTEWTNVVKGKPFYPDHRQPQLPGALGYYNLLDDDVRKSQAELASQYGIDGFCYYYYWFAGKRLLERPVEAMLSGGAPETPFCLCWANENWTRRWDGKEQEVLISQVHSAEDDLAIAEDLIRHFKDHRYIRIDGKPLMIIYRLDLLPDPGATIKCWRDACRRSSVGEIFLCAVRRFGMPDPKKCDVDALVEFPPHGCVAAELTASITHVDPRFRGRVFDFHDIVRDALRKRSSNVPVFPGVMPSWDNTARKGERAHVYHGGTPLRYRAWLAEAIRSAAEDATLPAPIVFVNAWNEWAEGCHLEPDVEYGFAWLRSTRAARQDAAEKSRLWNGMGKALGEVPSDVEQELSGAPLAEVVAVLRRGASRSESPTLQAKVFSALRRSVERLSGGRPAVRRVIVRLASWLGLAD